MLHQSKEKLVYAKVLVLLSMMVAMTTRGESNKHCFGFCNKHIAIVVRKGGGGGGAVTSRAELLTF
jgi:hypothetical protein